MVTSAPLFMADDLPLESPELDLSTFGAGSPILILPPAYRGSSRTPVPATVVTKARVWIEATEDRPELSRPRTWRLRLDDQTDGTGGNYHIRFRTPGQQRFHEAHYAALDYLSEQGIRLDYQSPWQTAPRMVQLARILWQEQNSHQDPPKFTVHHLDGTSTTT